MRTIERRYYPSGFVATIERGTRPSPRGVRFHESGHAVLASWLGWRITSVETDGAEGEVNVLASSNPTHQAAVAYAGQIAAIMGKCEDSRFVSEGDEAAIPADADKLEAVHLANQVLSAEWAKVERLAEALAKTLVMSGAEVAALLENHND